MSNALHRFIELDMLPMLAGALAALICGLLGNFLVLRRLSLMGDAISHAVLPGLVIAFIVTGTRDPVVMLVGAGLSGVATVVIVELVRRYGRVDPGAAMGVTFSVLFALGVFLIEQAARQVDLDADCVLHGQPELLGWSVPSDWGEFLSPATIAAVPRQIWILLGMLLVTLVFITALFKELRISSFDPQLATTQGVHAGLMHYMLMVLVAAATVASFEAVGSILVIAMIICPAVTARLLTDRLGSQLLVSAGAALLAAIGGYWLGALGPSLVGSDISLSAAGTMAVLAGVLFGCALLLSPRHGVLTQLRRQRRLSSRILLEDLLVTLRRAERAGESPVPIERLTPVLRGAASRAIELAERENLVKHEDASVGLSDAGRARADGVLQSHRQWQSYLIDEAGYLPDHAHDTAERLEHVAPSQDRPKSE